MNSFQRVALIFGVVGLCSLLGIGACVTATYVVTGSDFREEAERTETRELHLQSTSRVRVETPYGKVHVRSTDSGGGSLNALVRARGKTAEEAQARLERAQVVIDESSDGVRVSVAFTRDSGSSGEPAPSVDFELLVPAGVKLELASESGSVQAEGGPFGDSRLKSSYGSVRAENVNGDVTVESSSGSLAIHGQRGGHATAKTSYGKIVLNDIDATALSAETSSGSITATKLHAPAIVLASDYGAIQIDEVVGSLKAHSSSGSISIQDANATVDVRSDYGSVTVDGVLKALNVHASSGSVRVVARKGSVIDSDWRIRSEYGRVSLEAPQDLSFDLAAKTSYGQVDVDYAIELPPGSSTKRGAAVRGKVNGGGPLVTLESSSGSVRVAPLSAR